MALNVYKVADIVGDRLVPCRKDKLSAGELAAFLLKAEIRFTAQSSWTIDITWDAPPRRLRMDLPCSVKRDAAVPHLFAIDNLTGQCLIYFRNRLFIVERLPIDASENTELALRITKLIYNEEAELSSLRAAVANLEAAVEFQKSGPKRDPIPEDVKLLVWARGGGC
jgi:hypothetical protein